MVIVENDVIKLSTEGIALGLKDIAFHIAPFDSFTGTNVAKGGSISGATIPHAIDMNSVGGIDLDGFAGASGADDSSEFFGGDFDGLHIILLSVK